MPSIDQHIIRRQVLDVEVLGTEAQGFALQQSLSRLCHDWLTPALEPVLERAAPLQEHLTIDRLEIDVGTLGLDNLERELVQAVTQALEKLLRQRAPPAGTTSASGAIERRTQAQSVEDAFLHFLQTGSLPWWFHLPDGLTLESVIRAFWQSQSGGVRGSFGRAVVGALGSATVRRRLVRQFSAEFLDLLLAGISREAAAVRNEVFAKLAKRDVAAEERRRISERLWHAVFAVVGAGGRPTAGALVAEYLNSLPAAERQEPALRRIAQFWLEASSHASGHAEGALPDGASELDQRDLRSGASVEAAAGRDRAEDALQRNDRDTGSASLSEPDSEGGEVTLPPGESERDEKVPRGRGSTPDRKALLARDTAPRDVTNRGRNGARYTDGLPGGDRELDPTVSAGEREPSTKVLPGSRPQDKAQPFTDATVARARQAARDEALIPVDLKEGVYVRAAGLALLHPFLPQLFEALGIAMEDRLVQPERALCLLHFLATGQRVAPEYELLLPKLLCNIPFEEPVDTRIELTAAEEEEGVALLEAVIRHWGALGDTSVDGLREAFLVRPGKLSERNDGDRLLQVEARSFDILLDQLPWGIGTIQLPWMSRILWAEWR